MISVGSTTFDPTSYMIGKKSCYIGSQYSNEILDDAALMCWSNLNHTMAPSLVHSATSCVRMPVPQACSELSSWWAMSRKHQHNREAKVYSSERDEASSLGPVHVFNAVSATRCTALFAKFSKSAHRLLMMRGATNTTLL